MPTYEYECQKCGHRFELFQGMNDPPRKQCPKCRGRVKRLLGTGAGLLFKGSGFYVTDYRSDGYRSAVRAEKSVPASSGESKPTESASPKSKTAEKPATGKSKKKPS